MSRFPFAGTGSHYALGIQETIIVPQQASAARVPDCPFPSQGRRVTLEICAAWMHDQFFTDRSL